MLTLKIFPDQFYTFGQFTEDLKRNLGETLTEQTEAKEKAGFWFMQIPDGTERRIFETVKSLPVFTKPGNSI